MEELIAKLRKQQADLKAMGAEIDKSIKTMTAAIDKSIIEALQMADLMRQDLVNKNSANAKALREKDAAIDALKAQVASMEGHPDVVAAASAKKRERVEKLKLELAELDKP